MNVWPFIEAEEAERHSVKRACALLEVSRAAYYQQRNHGPSRRVVTDRALIERIRVIHATSRGTYGAPRVHRALREAGVRVAKKRVARLMAGAGLTGRCRRRWHKTTIAGPAAVPVVDLLTRDFAPGVDLDRRWCGDITYIPTWRGWAYLATVIDIGSRRVVGWTLGDHPRTDLVADALATACAQRRPPAGVIFHSDRGCQYTSSAYRTLADDLGVRLSVGRTGDCWDNAVAESFFATIKTELIDARPWPTITALRTALFDYIDGWYNTRRLHSSLDYTSPARYEAAINHHTANPAA